MSNGENSKQSWGDDGSLGRTTRDGGKLGGHQGAMGEYILLFPDVSMWVQHGPNVAKSMALMCCNMSLVYSYYFWGPYHILSFFDVSHHFLPHPKPSSLFQRIHICMWLATISSNRFKPRGANNIKPLKGQCFLTFFLAFFCVWNEDNPLIG